ncbi:Uncharacterized protein OBRU01_00948 [Operophtera brumata]|uniref:Uncharacterized protein n=1 Tax=Operophtera brumata TaxID=104452 RepID=A0A0L7LTY1_OPEBR|nr:Uncharacterized protein OBRU01_00948 [Operophtera brumata]
MDAKDLRIETALGERNDGSKYSQSGVALQCNRNKSYQDIGSNPLAKVEAAVRPCAVIGPDRVLPPPAPNDAYLKKASAELWPCPDNLYPPPTEYPHKSQHNVNPTRNISPRQTFQENMQRINVPPTYSAVKHSDESNLNHAQDRNTALSKNSKQTIAPEPKYCDVPYAVNLLTNEHKNVREMDMCAPSVNSPLARTAPHGWPPSGVNLHASRTYGAHNLYQYQQYPSCAAPRPLVMPVARPHRTCQEETSFVYQDPYYQDTSVRFKPYPSLKERYPQARYDYNYPNPFHPPPYATHKYDIPNTIPPHPYPVYSQLKYMDNRVPDSNIEEGYQRPNQQSINYSMPFRNQVIHPTYAPALGSTQNKVPSYPLDASIKSSNKPSFDNNKAYVDFENAKAKYSLPDSYFVNDMARVHQVQKPVALPNYTSPGMHPASLQQYHRKDNMAMKTFEYMPHYRHFEHPIGFNPLGHHPPQFSPSTLAISPTDSNTSNDTTQTQGTFQEDCGYVSQSSTTSARSVDSVFNRLPHEHYRRYDYRYRPIIGNSHMLPKSDLTNTKDNNKINVRQFLSMWNEGDEDNSANNNSKEITVPKIADTNNYTRRHESAKSQDQLYVLGLVNVPNEELAKYEHIQKVSKLPENIKGYNSIELLNQFEQVIKSSNMNSFKSSTSKEFVPMKDRKNAIKQIVEVLPRPVSPLDVESKISQSIIHKEVGCNFEIKPCSPKMMNVEIAAPVQNILAERDIKKVPNPLSNKSMSPLSMRMDGSTACNIIQRQESIHTPYENPSCKMVGSPFTANNMESVKTNYSLQDLETSSGVCLASLPRLDNEIELNFPEVNQQFINANKGDRNLQDKYSQELTEDIVKLTTASDNDTAKNHSEQHTNVSVEEDSGTELPKLSKYRKSKPSNLEYPDDGSNANASRTDSVIIKNPDNVRRFEEFKEKISPYRTADDEDNTPMNLTSQSSILVESEPDTINSPKQETQAIECALDFSLSKTENELPIINSYDGEMIKTTHSTHDVIMGSVAACLNDGNEIKDIIKGPKKPSKLSSDCASHGLNTKSIIVRNNRSASDSEIKFKDDVTLSGIEQNDESLETTYFTNPVEAKPLDNPDKINFNKSKINSIDKTSSANVIVKHKHKNKLKTSKAKTNIIKSNFKQETQHKTFIKGEKIPTRSLFDIHESLSHVADSEHIQQKPNNIKSVIQNNNLFDDCQQIEAAVTDVCKSEASKTKSAINNLAPEYHTTISEKEHFVENNIDNETNDYSSVVEETATNCKEITNMATENNVSDKIIISRSIKDNDCKTNDTTRLICDKVEVLESNAEINKSNKYYNDLISESELFLDKTYCMSEVLTATIQSPSNSFVPEENVFADDIKIPDNSTEVNVLDCVYQKSDTKKVNDTTNDQVLDNSEISKPGSEASGQDDECLKGLVSQSELNRNCSIDNNELDMGLFVDVASNNYIVANACDSIQEKVMENNDGNTKNEFERTNKTISAEIDESEHHTIVPDAVLVDKKYSIDSGYHSNKNSLAENDEGMIDVSGNSSEDCVFVEQVSELNQIALNDCIEKDGEKTNTLSVSDKSSSLISTSTSGSLVNTLITENQITVDSNLNNKMKILSKTSQSSYIYDSVDANMQILFEQPNKEIVSENVNIIENVGQANTEDSNFQLQKEHNKKYGEINVPVKTSQLSKECVDVEADGQTLLENQKELNPNQVIKQKEIEDSISDIQTKDVKCLNTLTQYDTQTENKNNNISSNSVNIMDMDVTCAKSLEEVKRDVKDRESLHSKIYSEYRGKGLYSPWIQKLIMYTDGKIAHIQCVDVTETKLQNDEVAINTFEKPKIDSVIKVATVDNAKIHSENTIEMILDIDLKNNHECNEINSKTSNSIDFTNDGSIHDSTISMDPKNQFDIICNQEINVGDSNFNENENKSEFDNECIEECDGQNDLIDTQAISFSYPNNSIISQITQNSFDTNESMLELKCEDKDKDGIKCGDANINCSPIKRRRSLKRSFSDSALNTHVSRDDHIQSIGNLHYAWPPKRNKMGEFENFLPNIRRNSVNIEENVSFCILIDDNCIITEESEEKICIAGLQEDYITEIDTGNDDDNTESLKELDSGAEETNVDLANSEVLECEEENPIQESWIQDIACAETVFSDEVAENVVISAPSSPTDSAEYEHDVSGIYYGSTTCSHTDKVKFMHGEKLSDEDAQIVDKLYRTPHMDIMNKTLLYGDKIVESDNNLSDSDQENILLESDDWKPSATHTPDYIDPTHVSNDFSLETPENKENVFVKELSPLRRIDDYLDVSSAENETDEHILQHVSESDITIRAGTLRSCESSLDDVFDYKLKDESTSTVKSSSYTSSSPEVSSTTSEEKNSSILLKITNLNGSRMSQINEKEANNRPRCKFTEIKEYSTSSLNFPNRPLITKAAQKYIPPIKESIRDLTVKITLPQQSLFKLKQLKLSRNEPKVHKQPNVIHRIAKKPKPNFDDVLKSIDEIQIKRHKEKSKKAKIVVPKVVIKKNENGSHYASAPKKDTFNPDLTGRKWQPWVFIEKNTFIDKMAIKNKTRAMFNHRKNTYVLAEQFKKYKSVSSTKFIISQPKTSGQLKYTIRLKHTY